ncbi:DUF3857 domain-containing protein [Kiritimatiella glycovorans]|uniref:Transglutaminase-like domain-containing protein n=1 Tax=Kiritimatiella glycovorans TaxID=1307763 RepID=A0A0G3EB16_9BACT|nr:DUF3857 domain-containing protein [Kiritimatiella glycovorans]AKJ63473.1 putative protein involved in cytokinesis [Kiritimatiella glycovorans]
MVVRRYAFMILAALLYVPGVLALEFPSADELRERGRRADLERFPNADAVMLSDLATVCYDASGVYTSRMDVAYRILTEKGKRTHRTQSLGFDRAYSRAYFERVEVIQPDGRVREVDLDENTREMASPGQMRSNIYNPNIRRLQLSVPGLEIGDILRYRARREVFKTRVPDTWSDRFLFEGTDPVLYAEFEIDAPAARPLEKISLSDSVGDTVDHAVTTHGNRILYRWTGRDIPRMFPEPSMPSQASVVQRVLVSTIPEWEELSRWYWNLSKPHLDAVTPAMKEKVAELTAEDATREENIRALFTWVSQNIRYMGITLEEEAPGYEPHDVDLTFDRGYGVCRDKAALLVAMLRLAGFDAYPVLMMVGPKKDETVPQPWFNHAIVGVREPDGSFRLMDPTDENTRNLLPRYLCDMSYLAATPEGVPLMTSPVYPAEENLARIETEGRLEADGRLRAETRIIFEGINDSAYRGHFARLRPGEREDFFEGRIEALVPGAKLRDLEIEPQPVRDTSRPLKAVFSWTADGLFAEQDDRRLFRPPEWGRIFGVTRSALSHTGLEEREYPLRIRFPSGLEESFRLELAPGLEAPRNLPAAEAIERDFFSWNRSLGAGSGVLTGRVSTRMKTIELSPDQYRELKAVLEDLEHADRHRVVFPAPLEEDPDADVVYLENRARHELDDARNWTSTRTVRKKVLTYAGKKEHAELKIHFNPAWEDVELEYARVIAPSGEVREIRDNETNLMDAGWVASAPRYPAGRILVASLPGVAPGSVIEYRVVRRTRNHPFFHLRAYLRNFNPVVYAAVEIDAPQGLDVAAGLEGGEGVAASSTGKNGRVIRRWEARRVRGLKRESDLPPLWTLAPTLLASTGEWPVYASALNERFRECAAAGTRAAEKARELVAPHGTRREKARAIRDYVAEQIRTAGPGFTGLPLEALSDADATLGSGYGHKADQAILLYAMLEAAGFEPGFVLASNLPRPDDLAQPLLDRPQRDIFRAPLVRIRLGGHDVYLNDTDQYAPLGSTTHDRRRALRLDDGSITRIESLPEYRDRREAEYVLDLDEDGSASIDWSRRYFGSDYTAFHREFAEMIPEERRRHFERLVSSIAQSAVPAGGLEVEHESYPGEQRCRVEADPYAVRDGDLLYFRLPEGLAGLQPYESDERTMPLHRDRYLRERTICRIRVPAGYVPVQDRDETRLRLPADGGEIILRRRYDAKERMLTVVHEADLRPCVVPAGEYLLLQNAAQRFERPAERTIILRRAEP